ncbi:MAG: 3-oxoacyl-[acyl-carrier-protein] reductase [Dehalococcoidia bacterium]|nr:3-oxoacyl-[acyl-carrier-protein] reductase [Dehalococcoidia bacterium]
MSGALAGKRALVTGASRGIGLAVALRFAAEGARVALNYRSDRAAAEEAAASIEAAGGEAVAVGGDVSRPDEAAALVESTVSAFGGVDVLVNNAGVTRDGLLLRMEEEAWDAVLDTNLKGAFLCSKAAARHMARARWGRIVNMSSIVGLTGNAGQANYASAKAGLIGLTKTLARELASRNITVNAVAPGFIATRMVESLSPETQSRVLERIPLGRFGTPEDVAAVCVFLASDDAGYVTGQTLGVDGGLVI